MNQEVIEGLWSASVSLADQVPLNNQESEAVAHLLNLLLGDFIPTVQEYKNCKEAVSNIKKCTTVDQKKYFESSISEYEQKYSLLK